MAGTNSATALKQPQRDKEGDVLDRLGLPCKVRYDKQKHFPTAESPTDSDRSKSAYGAVILAAGVAGAYKRIMQNLPEMDFAAYDPDVGKSDVTESYGEYRRKHSAAFALIDGYYNGIESGTRTDIENGMGFSDVRETGIYRRCFDWCRGFPWYNPKYNQEVRSAIVKTLSYASGGFGFGKGASHLLASYWKAMLENQMNSCRESGKYKNDLPYYYRATDISESFMAGKDPVKITVIGKNGEEKVKGLLEYCCTDETKLSRVIEPAKRWECFLESAEAIARVLSSLKFEDPREDKAARKKPNTVTFTLNYDERPSRPEPPALEEDAKTLPDSGVSVIECGSAETETSPLRRGLLRDFVVLQHEHWRARRTLSETLPESMERYVDLGGDLSGLSTVDSVYDLMKSHGSVLLHGGEGMGKSMISGLIYERMYHDFVTDESASIPVVVNPGMFLDSSPGSEELIPTIIRECGAGKDAGPFPDLGRFTLFVDGLDEYLEPNTDTLENMLLCIEPFSKLVSGRTELCRGLTGFFGHTVDLGDAVDAGRFRDIWERHSRVPADISDYGRWVPAERLTPLLAALCARYLGPDAVEGSIRKGQLYAAMVDGIVADKIRSVRKNSGERITPETCWIILDEYAWSRYRWAIKNFEDRLTYVSERSGCGKEAASVILRQFTEPGDMFGDRTFLHADLQDYLVARWLFRQTSMDDPGTEFLEVVFRTGVQHFLGEMLENEAASRQFANFCLKAYEDCSSDPDPLRRDIEKAKILHLLARAVFGGNLFAKSTFDGLASNILQTGRESPQHSVALLCSSMLGRMDREDAYCRLLRENGKTAAFSRILYMMYEGDTDNLDLGPDGRRYCIDNTAAHLVRDLFTPGANSITRNVCRIHAIMVNQMLDMGYTASGNLFRRLGEIDPVRVCRNMITGDVAANLRDYGFDPDAYCKDLENELIELRRKALSLI